MSKHTPGPWNIHSHYANPELFTVDPQDGSEPWIACQTYVAEGIKIVCQVQMQTAKGGWPTVTDQREMLANAALIAAAPELLEAVESLLLSPDLCWDELEPATYKAIETARAAIAKAKGDR